MYPRTLGAWETTDGATIEYSEWWMTDKWWEHYPSKSCAIAGLPDPPLDLVLEAFREATREELVVYLSLLAQMHHEYAPSVATLRRPSAEERPYIQRLINASIGDVDCWVPSREPRKWGRPENAEAHVNERFWEMLDRVTIGAEPEEPTPGEGSVWVGPGETEPEDAAPPPTYTPPPPSSGNGSGSGGGHSSGGDDYVDIGLEYDVPGRDKIGLAVLGALTLVAGAYAWRSNRS